jgi:HD-GYP domain-containing protein (c-di-GMP phosphodiesterase class II)
MQNINLLAFPGGMILSPKQPRQDIEKRIRDLENEIKRLKKHGQATRSKLKKTQAELQSSADRLRKTMGGIIQVMSLTIEKRDPYTAGHQRRVTKLCRAIATTMGFSWERVQGFRMAAAIHDLGKIRVPAEILSKPGRLTENEFGIIRTHPQVGFEILKGIEFAWPIAQIVLQHHERMDGSGYPQGLSGEDILLEARILAVADVVEAMSSHRPYRPALGLERATAEIRQQSGILYDADVVDACLKAMADSKTLLQQTLPQET